MNRFKASVYLAVRVTLLRLARLAATFGMEWEPTATQGDDGGIRTTRKTSLCLACRRSRIIGSIRPMKAYIWESGITSSRTLRLEQS